MDEFFGRVVKRLNQAVVPEARVFSVVMLNVFSCVEKGALTLASHSALTAVLAMATVCTPFQSVEEVADVVAVLPTPQIGQTRLSVEAVAVISGCLQQNNPVSVPAQYRYISLGQTTTLGLLCSPQPDQASAGCQRRAVWSICRPRTA